MDMRNEFSELKNLNVTIIKPLTSSSKLLNPIIILIKQVIRRVLSFLLEPIVSDINEYHRKLEKVIELDFKESNKFILANIRTYESFQLEYYKEKYGVKDSCLTRQQDLKSMLVSQLACTQDIFNLSSWVNQMGYSTIPLNRKMWEWVYIVQVLSERNMMTPGHKAIGFAVGTEPLPALFAKYGIQIVATDLGIEEEQSAKWNNGIEHANNLSMLENPCVCDKDTFYKYVSFMPLNMNNIPNTVNGYDFCWSSCAFEHLGSVEFGRSFILNTLKVIKPGGVSVHTTEFNLTSDKSIDIPYNAIYGKDFFESLRKEINDMGHYFATIDYRLGVHPSDDYISWPDYKDAHFKLNYNGYITTSIGIIVVKKYT